jgi:hypothetical protein
MVTWWNTPSLRSQSRTILSSYSTTRSPQLARPREPGPWSRSLGLRIHGRGGVLLAASTAAALIWTPSRSDGPVPVPHIKIETSQDYRLKP